MTLVSMKATAISILGAFLSLGSAFDVDRSHVAVSQDSRVQYIVVHYTACGFARSMYLLTKTGVSSHYLVRDSPAKIYQLVDETQRAYHAGVSEWQGTTKLNNSSVGIEIVNLGYLTKSDGSVEYVDFPEAQADVVIELIADIQRRHNVQRNRIIGHNEIAPSRKQDPGPKFPWKRLAERGMIVWPEDEVVASLLDEYSISPPKELSDALSWQEGLKQCGYGISLTGEFDAQTKDTIVAFQMKYRQLDYSGEADVHTFALMQALLHANKLAYPQSLGLGYQATEIENEGESSEDLLDDVKLQRI